MVVSRTGNCAFNLVFCLRCGLCFNYDHSAHLILNGDAALAVQGVGDVDGERPGIAIFPVGAGATHVNGVLLRVVDGRGEEGLAEALEPAVQRILAVILVARVGNILLPKCNSRNLTLNMQCMSDTRLSFMRTKHMILKTA